MRLRNDPRRPGTGARLTAIVFAFALFVGTSRAQDGAEPPLPPPSVAEISASTERGVRFLLERQQLDGSWRADERRYVAGQTGLCLYTLLKAGIRKDHPAIERGFSFIRAHPPRWTYGIACCLMAYQTADVERYAVEIEQLTELLLECQGKGFSYPGQHEDLSLTQYGCLGLRAAEASGLRVPREIWEAIQEYTFGRQLEDGGFSYRPGTAITGSMTAAGIAALEISRQALNAGGDLSNREARLMNEEVDIAIDRGVEWLGRHMLVDRNPDPNVEGGGAKMSRWTLYYLYGLERVGGLTGRDKFGPRDWYDEVSRGLVDAQHDDGGWGTTSGEKMSGTCFGILFIKRATAPSSGTTPASMRTYGDDDPKRALSLRGAGDEPLSVWVSSWGERTCMQHEWDDERGAGPRVWMVEYVDVASGEVMATTKGDPESPARTNRFGAQISFPRPGTYEIIARAHLRPIDDEDDEHVLVNSQSIKVRIDGVLTDAMKEASEDLSRNELVNTKTTATCSTEHDGHKAAFALDGTVSYGWLCLQDDAQPWLEIEPARPQRATHVVLAPHIKSPIRQRNWGRPKTIELRVNGKPAGTHELVDDPMSKIYIPLAKRTTVRKVKVTVLERYDGSEGALGKAVGISEIELQLRPDLLREQQRAAKQAEKEAMRERLKKKNGR